MQSGHARMAISTAVVPCAPRRLHQCHPQLEHTIEVTNVYALSYLSSYLACSATIWTSSAVYLMVAGKAPAAAASVAYHLFPAAGAAWRLLPATGRFAALSLSSQHPAPETANWMVLPLLLLHLSGGYQLPAAPHPSESLRLPARTCRACSSCPKCPGSGPTLLPWPPAVCEVDRRRRTQDSPSVLQRARLPQFVLPHQRE